MAMSGLQKKKGKAANRKAWVGEVETEWAEPISQEAKEWVSQHLEAKLKKYGGRLTQAAAVKVTLMDRKLQRYVNSEGLDMRASDVAWAWVEQQVREGRVVLGRKCFVQRWGSWHSPTSRCCGSWWHRRPWDGTSQSDKRSAG